MLRNNVFLPSVLLWGINQKFYSVTRFFPILEILPILHWAPPLLHAPSPYTLLIFFYVFNKFIYLFLSISPVFPISTLFMFSTVFLCIHASTNPSHFNVLAVFPHSFSLLFPLYFLYFLFPCLSLLSISPIASPTVFFPAFFPLSLTLPWSSPCLSFLCLTSPPFFPLHHFPAFLSSGPLPWISSSAFLTLAFRSSASLPCLSSPVFRIPLPLFPLVYSPVFLSLFILSALLPLASLPCLSHSCLLFPAFYYTFLSYLSFLAFYPTALLSSLFLLSSSAALPQPFFCPFSPSLCDAGHRLKNLRCCRMQ